MYRFNSDYTEGCHPAILERLAATNMDQTDGYGLDPYCDEARTKIKEYFSCPNADVHFLVGGTQTNLTVICAALRPHQAVFGAVPSHINTHEAGAIEHVGHRVLPLPSEDGKLTAEQIKAEWIKYDTDPSREHWAQPKMVYISQPTEIGSMYSKKELQDLYAVCKEAGLYLFVDGARLGYVLGAPANDMTPADLAANCDVFYIGGTKIGALFGEALIILNDDINDHFRYMVKRACALLAKGRLIAIQLKALLEGGENSLYYELSRHENELAIKLAKGVTDKGYQLWIPHQTNQVFVIVDNDKIKELEKDFFFYTWCPYDETRSVIRLVISWGSTEEDVDAILAAL